MQRPDVVKYLADKYGHNHVAQIGTYGTLSTKMVLKDVGKVLGIDHNVITNLNKHIPSNQGKVLPLADALTEVPQVAEFQKLYPDLFELALDIQSLPRSASSHPCGYLISPTDLTTSVPLMRGKKGEVITCYEGGELEDIGYIKSDILGLKNLSVIEETRKAVLSRHGIDIEVKNFDFVDKKVFEMIKSGDTVGLFQIELKWLSCFSNKA